MKSYNIENQNKSSIMIVDDSLDSLRILTELLLAEGYKVRPANKGALALASIYAEIPDLILLDVRMPDIDGYEVCKQLKANETTRKIPVIFISGLENTLYKVKGFMLGGVDFIVKPFQQEEVLVRVKTHLELRLLQLQLEESNIMLEETNAMLEETNAALEEEIQERQRAEADIKKLNDELENRVADRTNQLQDMNAILEKEIQEKTMIYERLEKYQVLAEKANDAMLFIDKEGNILEANDAAIRIYGYNYKEFSSMNIYDLRRLDKSNMITKQMETADQKGIIFETVHYLKNGKPIEVEVSSLGTFLGEKRVLLSIIRDVTERKKSEKKILNLSYHDQLTGLYNRRFYEEELQRLDSKRNLPITIVMGDVNGLKLINDSFGHAIGDELIKKVAEVITKICRADDIIARLGGDEFVIILPKTDGFEAEQFIKRITDSAQREKVGSIDISISFGYETKNNEEEMIEDIFKNAEDHMYKKKLFESPSMRGKTIKAIVNTLHEKNKREEQHSHRVSEICRNMGEVLRLPEYENEELRTVGLLHDIGKIAIDENVLNKPGKLCEAEWEEIKRHPEIGYRILSTVNDMSQMADYVLAHHERWDGKGYPKGLKREEIPFVSRIIAIADAYDAMTSERSYRAALSREVVIEELVKNAGIQFDPDLIRIFIDEVLGQVAY